MPEIGERLDKVEQRLGGVETGLNDLKERVDGLRGEVNQLRILGENNTEDIRKVAEVQAHHGKKLEEISRALEPLTRIDAFVTAVAHEHERRITALEDHTGMPRQTA